MDDELLNNLPRTQEKAEKTPEEKPSTLEWARKRFAEMSPEEQEKTKAAFLKLTRTIID